MSGSIPGAGKNEKVSCANIEIAVRGEGGSPEITVEPDKSFVS